MKKIIILLLGFILLASVLIFGIFSPGSKFLPKIPIPDETEKLSPIITQSTVFIPVEISTGLIANTLEAQVPGSINQTKRLDIGGPIREERVELSGSRQPLNTSTSENGISVAGTINQIRARVRGSIDLLLGSTSFSQSIRGNVRFKLSSKPEFTTDWKIDPNLDYNFTVPNMEARIARVGRVSVRGKTKEALDGLGKKYKTEYRDNFPLNDKFYSGSGDLWKQAHQVIELYDQPKTWLITTPKSFQVMQPIFDETSMRLGLGMQLQNQVLVSDEMPVQEIAKLPELLEIIIEPSEENFNLSIPVALDFAALNLAASQEIKNRAPKIEQDIAGEKVTLSLLGIKLMPSGSGLIVEIDVKSRSGGLFGNKATGKVYLLATPHLNKATNKLEFLNLDYHADTKSALTNAAAYLLKPVVLSNIQNELSIDLSALETDAISKAKTEIGELNNRIPDGMAIKLDPTELKLNDLIVSKDYLHLIMAVKARVDVEINDSFFVPPSE